MAEIPTPTEAIQTWLELHIIGKAICPPLSRLSHRFRSENGKIDWDEFSKVIPVTDLTGLDVNAPEAITTVASRYYAHLNAIHNNTSFDSEILVLSDFESNDRYSQFMRQVNEFSNMMLNFYEPRMARDLYLRFYIGKPIKPEIMRLILDAGSSNDELVRMLTTGLFRPIIFYGKPINMKHFIAPDRGPEARNPYMAEAPYNAVQFIDPVKAHQQKSTDVGKTYEHNNKLTEQSIEDFRAFIAGIRNGTVK